MLFVKFCYIFIKKRCIKFQIYLSHHNSCGSIKKSLYEGFSNTTYCSTFQKHHRLNLQSRVNCWLLKLSANIHYSPFAISTMLTYDPVRKPTRPKQINKEFFQSRQLYLPRPGSSQNVTKSIIAGNISPSVDKQTAPTKEIKPPKFGIAIAIQTVPVTITIRIKYS